MGLRFTGTLGILLRARNQGAIQTVAPYLASLREAGFRVSDRLAGMILELAGEAP
jgi:predicted nucleic acid-binding protein